MYSIYIFTLIIILTSCILNLDTTKQDKYMGKLLIFIYIVCMIVMLATVGYYKDNTGLLMKVPMVSTISYCIIYLLTYYNVDYIAPLAEKLGILLAVAIATTNGVSIYYNNVSRIFTFLLGVYFIASLILFIFIIGINYRREKWESGID